MRSLYLFFLHTFIVLSVAAQTDYRIEGKVYDSADGSPCAYSNVIVLKDTTITNQQPIKSTTTDSVGRYAVSLQKGSYILKVSLIGYKTGYFRITVNGAQDNVHIALKEESNKLKEAVVSTSYIKDKGDRFEVTVAENPLFNQEMMLSALDLIPNMDGLSVYGRNIGLVYVNGRPLKGISPEKYLQSLPTEMVESIEVYPFGAVEFGGDGAVLKVKLKKQDNGVVLGHISPDFAFHRKGITNLEASSALTFSVGKWSSITTFHGTEHTKTLFAPTDTKIEKVYFDEGTAYYGTTNGKTGKARTYEIDESLFYDISDKHQLSFGFSTSIIPKYEEFSFEDYTVDYKNTVRAFKKSRTFKEDWNEKKFDIYGQYKWVIDKAGTDLQFSLNYLQQKSNNEQPDSVSYQWLAEMEGDTLKKEISFQDENGINRTYSPAIDGHWAFNGGQWGNLSYGVKYIYTTQELVRDFKSAVNGETLLYNENLSADYFYKEGITKIYASYGRQLAGDRIYFTAGGNYRNYYSSFSDHLDKQKLSRNYNAIEPMIFWHWKIRKHNVNYYTLNVTLSTSTNLNNARDLYVSFDRSNDKEITFNTGNDKTSRSYNVTFNSLLTKKFTITTGMSWNTNVKVYRTFLKNDTIFNEVTQNGDYFNWEFNGSYQDYIAKGLFLTLGGTAHAEVRRWEYGEPYKQMWWYSVFTSLRWKRKKWTINGTAYVVSARTTPNLYKRPAYMRSNFRIRYSPTRNLSLTLSGNATFPKVYNKLNTATYYITRSVNSKANFFFIVNWNFNNKSKKKVDIQPLDRNSDAQQRNQ